MNKPFTIPPMDEAELACREIWDLAYRVRKFQLDDACKYRLREAREYLDQALGESHE